MTRRDVLDALLIVPAVALFWFLAWVMGVIR